jgi:hypothetical protein
MGEKTHNILDHSDRLADLPSDSMNIAIVNKTLSVLHVLQHFGDSSSDLTLNE